MKRLLSALLIGGIVLGLGCAGDAGKGDQFMEQGKPDLALRFYEKALTKKKDDPLLVKKIVKANLLLAKQIIPLEQLDRAKYCLEAVTAKYPNEKPEDVRKELSEVKALFGEALKKKNNVKEAVDALEEALALDKDNAIARRVLDESKEAYAEILLQRAQDALVTKEYGVAEWNINKALEYQPGNKQAARLLVKSRKDGLSVYDKNQDICIAVSDVKRMKYKSLMMVFILNNYDDDWFQVKPGYFTLVDTRGRKYGYKPKIYGRVAKRMPSKDLKPEPKYNEAEGALVFGVSRGAKIQKLVFDDGKGHTVEKYFP